ncbi:MAG TPA: hypothetical protein VMY87_07500 [Armatimonadota bacterium]|nr:hypothetical protein [Armatimonadota bacterium]
MDGVDGAEVCGPVDAAGAGEAEPGAGEAEVEAGEAEVGEAAEGRLQTRSRCLPAWNSDHHTMWC